WVRYRWLPRPEAGTDRPEAAREGSPAGPGDRDRHYLGTELAARLDRGPVVFDLELEIAGPGDDPHDPTSVWGPRARRTGAGSLRLTATTEEHDGIIFDPMRLTDGIEASEDPILHFRPRAYAVSYDRRTGTGHQRPPWAS
ncbi:MAG TPA: hypothetical protein VKA36_06030, partial [Solirubrobacterales bacterium]|nr:hypothetical protein [Solirubrobacterales bacterium]